MPGTRRVSRVFFLPNFSGQEQGEMVKMNDKSSQHSFWTSFAKVFLAFLQE